MISQPPISLLSLLALFLRLAVASVATSPVTADAQPTAGPAPETSHEDPAAPTPSATATGTDIPTAFSPTAPSTFATVTTAPLVGRGRNLAPLGPKETITVEDVTKEDQLIMLHPVPWRTVHRTASNSDASYMKPPQDPCCIM